MSLTNEYIQQRLTERFATQVSGFEETYGMCSFDISADKNLEALQFLFETQELGFRFLTDITAVHYPDRPGAELSVVYHLHNLVANKRIRMRAAVPVAQPVLMSAVSLFSSANWMERETYDFFGVEFSGHPDLRRILNVEEMDYFPMRKEFPMEDPTRLDKDDEMFGR